MSPILVRPVREQFEHDRVIRLLQARWRRRHDVVANVGEERNAGVKLGTAQFYPDLIIYAPGRARRVQAVVEVETSESVNNLEALAEWAHFGRAPGEFHLYVPAGSADIARRLAADNGIAVSEIWAYHPVGDEMRFTLVHRAPPPAEPRRGPVRADRAAARKPVRRGKTKAKTAGKGVKKKTRARAAGRSSRRR